MRADSLSISAKGRYHVDHDPHKKITRLIRNDIGGRHLVGAYPWAVHGEQGAFDAAHCKLKQETEAIDVFSC